MSRLYYYPSRDVCWIPSTNFLLTVNIQTTVTLQDNKTSVRFGLKTVEDNWANKYQTI